MEKIIDYKTVVQNKDRLIRFSELKDSYMYFHLKSGDGYHLEVEQKALKFDGALLMLIRSGSGFDLEINMETYHVMPDMVVAGWAGSVIQVPHGLPDDIEADLLFFNMSFLQNININITSIPIPTVYERPRPVIQFEREECDILRKYFELMYINAENNDNNQINKNIGAAIIAALVYQLIQFRHRRLAEVPGSSSRPGSRRNEYVREFVKLVYIHYMRERSVTFYADKLFISPKYLSLLVKESTGQSASRWIDDFVITEAKNMLRFSGKNIQQVAYALNFSTQSSFGKYFKHLTGMSPTEYQKS